MSVILNLLQFSLTLSDYLTIAYTKFYIISTQQLCKIKVYASYASREWFSHDLNPFVEISSKQNKELVD